MKVVVDARMISMSGIGRYVISNIIVMSNFYNLSVLLYRKDIDLLNELDLHCEIIYVKSEIFSIYEQLEILLKCPKCNIYWSPQFNLPILIKIKADKIVTTVCDILPLVEPGSSLLRRLYTYFFVNFVFFVSERVITISEFSKSEILRFLAFFKSKISVIKCGAVKLASYDCPSKPNSPYLLVVGNVKPHKNIDVVVKSFLSISNTYKHLKLVIVGKVDGFTTNKTELIDELKCNDRILFTGYVSDEELYCLYKNATLYIMPSTYEGFGLPVLEAISTDVPVALSDIPVFRELFKEIDYFFNPNSYIDLANLIVSIIENGYEKKGYSNLLSRYTWEKSQDKHIDLFNNIINNKK